MKKRSAFRVIAFAVCVLTFKGTLGVTSASAATVRPDHTVCNYC